MPVHIPLLSKGYFNLQFQRNTLLQGNFSLFVSRVAAVGELWAGLIRLVLFAHPSTIATWSLAATLTRFQVGHSIDRVPPPTDE